MMLPGITIWPPNFLTPSRRPALSRPLREEPPAFLCAIADLLRLYRRLLLLLGRPSAPRPALGVDLGDPQQRLVLAVAVLAPVILPPLLLEDDDLGGAALLDQGGADRGAGQQRRAGRHAGAVADHQHLGELNGRARLAVELLDGNHVVRGDLVLLAAGADHCKHGITGIWLCRYRLAQLPRQPLPWQKCTPDGPPRRRGAHYRRAGPSVNLLRANGSPPL